MFDFSWSELLLIGIVALVVIGPKELPGVLRTLGQWMGKVRRMANEFQHQFQDAMREAELADLKKDVESYAKFDPLDPLADVKKDMQNAEREIESALTDPSSQPAAAKETPAEPAPQAAPQAAEAPVAEAQRTEEPTAAPPAPEAGKEPAQETPGGSRAA
jgi:sec-independent protein translocase protein TatB